jgi:hypothetical protein
VLVTAQTFFTQTKSIMETLAKYIQEHNLRPNELMVEIKVKHTLREEGSLIEVESCHT